MSDSKGERPVRTRTRRRSMAPPAAAPIVVVDGHCEAPQIVSVGGGEAAFLSARCPGREGANEDALAVIPLGGGRAVLAVADGLGGQPAGEQASRVALEALRDALAAIGESEREDLRPRILDAIESANRRILALGVGAATTLSVAEVDGRRLRPYHVGDSLVLVTSGRGRIKLQTVSHSPVGYAVEAGMLDERDALHHEDRHLISNLVGSDEMRIDVGSPLELAPRDTVLLATDGLLDNLHLDEIVERMRRGPLLDAAAQLAAEARGRMEMRPAGLPSKPDDLTFVLFRPGRG